MPSKGYVLAMLEKHYQENLKYMHDFEKMANKHGVIKDAIIRPAKTIPDGKVSYQVSFVNLPASLLLACSYHRITEYKGIKI